jgi:hypothetical protein
VAVCLPSGMYFLRSDTCRWPCQSYIMLPGFNDRHQHCVLAGKPQPRDPGRCQDPSAASTAPTPPTLAKNILFLPKWFKMVNKFCTDNGWISGTIPRFSSTHRCLEADWLQEGVGGMRTGCRKHAGKLGGRLTEGACKVSTQHKP